MGWLAVGLWLAACGVPSTPPPVETGEMAAHARLAQGVAQAEIEQWAEARDCFEEVAARPGAPAAAFYDLAVAQFRLGEMDAARVTLERLDGVAPDGVAPDGVAPDGVAPDGDGGARGLAHRPDLLRARLAYESGDADGELELLRAARRRHGDEPAVLHALASALERLRPPPSELGEVREAAWRAWPENSRLASAFAAWALAEPGRQEEGLELLEQLVIEIAPLVPRGGEMLEDLLEEGRSALAASASGGGAGAVPGALRRVLNLLRSSPRFSADAAALEARLEIVPLAPDLPPDEPDPPTVALRFELAEEGWLPALPWAGGIVDAIRIDDALPASDDPPAAETSREAMVAVVSEHGMAVLPRRGPWQRIEGSGGADRLLAGDFDDDGRPELVALEADGLKVWGRGTSLGEAFSPFPTPDLPPELALPLADALALDFEHDGDLDLLLVDASGQTWWMMHRGEAGLGPPERVALDPSGDFEVLRLVAHDLDHDDDQDLVAVVRRSEGSHELVWLRNWRQGHYTAYQRLPLARPVLDLVAAELDGDDRPDVAILDDHGTLTLHRGLELARLAEAEILAEPMSRQGASPGSGRMLVADLDLDGRLELLVVGDGGARRFAREGADVSATVLDESRRRGAIVLDLEGDRAPDLLVWGDPSPEPSSEPSSIAALDALLGRGAEGRHWIELALRAPERKVPRDGHGVRVAVTAGHRTHHYQPQRANLVLGTGHHEPALVVATWPNGISEYLFSPATRTRHELALSLRVEGSCPFLYAFDGERLRFVSDILGLAPLGMLASRRSFVPADPEEYLRLPDWVRPRDGWLELEITEELREATYLDQSELVVVDAPPGVEVYNGEQWLARPVEGLELRLLGPLQRLAGVRDASGAEVGDVLARLDGRHLANHRGLEPGGRRYQGVVEPHSLELELERSALGRRGALLLVGWLHWGNTSTNVARSQDPAGAPLFPRLEVADGSGGWRDTGIAVGLPAGKTKPVVVDLGDPDRLAPATGDTIRLRLTTDFEVYWDQLAVAELLPPDQTPHRVHRLPPSRATLGFGGFARWYRESPEGPYLFDLAERRPYPWRLTPEGDEVTLAWRELEGHYTAFGDVTRRLETADDRLVIFGSGDALALRFDLEALPPAPEGWHRVYFLHSEGWEKDGDPNVACGTTVEPLPYRGMAGDPCALVEPRPASPGQHTRWVSAERLLRRLEAMGQLDHPEG